MTPDVLVVGAGPAGAVAATILARAGARVVMVDRSRFPRPKLCGDSVNPGTLAILRRLGVAAVVERHGLRMDGMLVSGPRVAVEGRYPEGLHGITIERRVLDAVLVGAAVEAGVDLREEVAARSPIVDGGGATAAVGGAICSSRRALPAALRARVTIAADGRRSALAFALGLAVHPTHPRRWAVGGYFEHAVHHGPVGEMHIRNGHYVGIAPVPGGSTNVCLVLSPGSGDPRLRDPVAGLRQALGGDPRLRDRFASAALVGRPVVLGPLGVDGVRGNPPSGLLVAGDASGFVDPMTGDGLRFALRGGELAAEAALRVLAQGWSGVHAWHAAARRAEFGSKWRFNRALRALVGSPGGVHVAEAGARLSPQILRALIRRAGDCDGAVSRVR